jgi:hypothetical protein
MIAEDLLMHRGAEGGCGCLPDFDIGIRVPCGEKSLHDLRAAGIQIAKLLRRIPSPSIDVFELQVLQEPIDVRSIRQFTSVLLFQLLEEVVHVCPMFSRGVSGTGRVGRR